MPIKLGAKTGNKIFPFRKKAKTYFQKFIKGSASARDFAISPLPKTAQFPPPPRSENRKSGEAEYEG